MTIQELLDQMNAENAIDSILKLSQRWQKQIKFGARVLTIQEVLWQFDPNWHDVHDRSLRKDKVIQVPMQSDLPENPGNPDGRTRPEVIKTNRSSAPYQKLIVNRAASFLTGNPTTFSANPANDKETELFKAVQRVYDINKMDYKNNALATLMMSETQAAELWYVVDNSQNSTDASRSNVNDFEGININTRGLSLKVKLLAKSLGDDLYPIYDYTGNMIAFLRRYTENDENNVITNVSELYQDNKTTIVRQVNGRPDIDYKEYKNTIGKIPIIYYNQLAPEWLDVQHNINRSEDLISNVGNINDDHAAPITVVNGDLLGFHKKGETGKVIAVEKDAKVSLLEAKNSIESLKFERDTQKQIIFEATQTPDISFESMKSLGVFSGIAIKMLFFDAELKVKSKLATYGESKQRSINFIKAALAKFDITFSVASFMQIKPVITAYLPANIEEALQNLSVATGNQPIMSVDTAVRLNPLVDKPEEEIQLLGKQKEAALGAPGGPLAA